MSKRIGARPPSWSFLSVALAALLVPVNAAGPPEETPKPAARAFVRVNQVGYVAEGGKLAYLMSTASQAGATFDVVEVGGGVVHTGPVGGSIGAWSATFDHVYILDLSVVGDSGRYRIVVDGPVPATSPRFRIGTGAALYRGLLPNALKFFRAQRDGPDVLPLDLDRRPAHLNDAEAMVYESPVYEDYVLQDDLVQIGGPVDVRGGWFDAGDYPKFVQTTNYTAIMMLIGVRDLPGLLGSGPGNFTAEARFGLDWLLRTWDGQSRTLYHQVGLIDGNGCGSICGDHDVWRLPQDDDTFGGSAPRFRYIRDRPVFRAGDPGSRLSPNLAGRNAAAFALCFQVFRESAPAYATRCLREAQRIFDLAKTDWQGDLVTIEPFDGYPETEWRDDMELAAAELALAVAGGGLPGGLPHTDPAFYLRKAARWAEAYMQGDQHGFDWLNLYDVSSLGHFELHRAIDLAGDPGGIAVTQQDLVDDLEYQLNRAVNRAKQDLFDLGYPYNYGDVVPHALGLSIQAGLYDELTGTKRYAAFGRKQLNFVLGANPWGTSFVVGAGTTFPHCMQHQVANLEGSLDGTPPLVLGATVDGPTDASNFQDIGVPDGARACPANGADPFRQFTGHGMRYMDDVRAWPSVEPAIDYTAPTILAFARQAAGLA